MSLEFKTAKRRIDPINFTLDGRAMTFIPPKSAVMVLPVIDNAADETAILRATFDWLGEGLGEDDIAFLLNRLRDKEDDLDIDGLGEIVQGLGEEIAGRPTT